MSILIDGSVIDGYVAVKVEVLRERCLKLIEYHSKRNKDQKEEFILKEIDKWNNSWKGKVFGKTNRDKVIEKHTPLTIHENLYASKYFSFEYGENVLKYSKILLTLEVSGLDHVLLSISDVYFIFNKNLDE